MWVEGEEASYRALYGCAPLLLGSRERGDSVYDCEGSWARDGRGSWMMHSEARGVCNSGVSGFLVGKRVEVEEAVY